MSKLGRNDPCHCGSGKKFKQCCIHLTVVPINVVPTPATPPLGNHFKEAQKEAAAYVRRHNTTPLKELAGLSPETMHRLLKGDIAAPNVITWHPKLTDVCLQSPAFLVAKTLLQGISNKPVKLTAAGYLPTALVGSAGQAIDAIYTRELQYMQPVVKKENDAREIETMHYVLDFAGITHTTQTHWQLKAPLHNYDDAALFKKLFNTYVFSYNWADEDLFTDELDVQFATYFLLYIIAKKPHAFTDEDLCEQLLQTFPPLMQQVKAVSANQPQRPHLLRRVLKTRFLQRFLGYWGLVEGAGKKNILDVNTFKKTALFAQIFAY